MERWGEGVSLVRGKWKDRSSPDSQTSPRTKGAMRESKVNEEESESDDSDSDEDDAMSEDDVEPKKSSAPTSVTTGRPTPIRKAQSPVASRNTVLKTSTGISVQPKPKTEANDDALDGLASEMGSLNLIPRSIHFGRSKPKGFVHSTPNK